MSIFNDKALKGVAEAVSKIVDEELSGNQHKIDANKNGKVDAHDFKLLRAKKGMKEAAEKMAKKDHDQDGKIESGKAEFLGSRIRAARAAGKLKEEAELDEAFPTVDDAKKRMAAGKTATGSVTKTKTGLVHSRDYKDDADDTPSRATKGYGARQNATSRGTSMGTSGGRKAGAKKANPKFNEKDYQEGGAKHTGKMYKTESPSKRKTVLKHYEYLGKNMGESYSFTEMLELYNEHGVEVINKIFPQTVKFGDTEVELIDANEVNGVVGITVAEEVDNETFTKEVEAQKEKNAGRGKKAEVAKASVQAVKQEEVETPPIHVRSMYTKHYAKHGGTISKAKEASTKAYDAVEKMHGKEMRDKLQTFHRKNMNEETEQLDELSKDTLSMYVKKAHYSGGMADFKHGRIADKRGDSKDKMKLSKISRNRERGINKAVDRLTKKD